MLIIRGCTALSDFRLANILRALQALSSGIISLHTEHVHFVQLLEKLSEAEYEHLLQLLDYGVLPSRQAEFNEHSLLVVPR